MAVWPGDQLMVEEAVNLLDIGDAQWIQAHLLRAIHGAEWRVEVDAGLADDDVPNDQLVQAVFRAVAVMRVNAPDDGWRALGRDHIYTSLLKGSRRSFGIS